VQTTGNTLGLKIGNGQIRAMVHRTKRRVAGAMGDGGAYVTRSLAHMASMRTVS
jgi:hypothetical protein